MKYTTEHIFTKAKELIPKHKLIFIEDVVAMIGIAKKTFYNHIDVDSNEMHELRGLLDENKIAIKVGIRQKWYKSDNPTAQMALYKLCSTSEEHKKLQQNYVDHSGNINLPPTLEPLKFDETDNDSEQDSAT